MFYRTFVLLLWTFVSAAVSSHLLIIRVWSLAAGCIWSRLVFHFASRYGTHSSSDLLLLPPLLLLCLFLALDQKQKQGCWELLYPRQILLSLLISEAPLCEVPQRGESRWKVLNPPDVLFNISFALKKIYIRGKSLWGEVSLADIWKIH